MRVFFILYRRGLSSKKKKVKKIRDKNYYNIKNIAEEIHRKTGYSPDDITSILKSLGDVVKDKVSDEGNVEIKLFPGLKVTSRLIKPNDSKSNLNISKIGFILSIKASFSDHFKKEVRAIHNK